ncbi:TPA: trichloroethylene chemotactic transducer CttP, partial [Pseudomonas aeruginosa]
MRESLGVSLPSRPLLLKLGLLSLPWALCAGLHTVGLGVWLALALGWFASLAMLFLLLRDPRQAVANASPQADAASPAWSAAQRALADETAQLDGHARQIDELLHSAIRQLSDSFHGLAERIDTQRGLSHSLIERYDGRGQVDEGINFQDFVRTTQQTLSLFVEATLETSRTSQQLVERMDQVRLKITEILQSTQDMDAIAKQTNLLALNAA